MAFCAFDDSAALFDSTPVENMFITEYMLRAPGDFVKVYLYALMLCYHPSPRMSLSAMAKDLDMQEEDVERAFKYWARDGLVRQVGDNPVRFTLANLKQLTLTRAENPGDKLYNEKFIREAERILKRTLLPEETNLINDWVQVFELPEEVVLMLLQIEMENSRGRVSIKIADGRAKEWAQSGIRTVDDVEKVVVMGVMLEAFCDLTDFDALAGFDTVQEVYAPWHALEEQSLSGRLLTNIFAGGTVDTEWGFLTGASEHDEYRGATGSYVRYFTAQGYAAHYAHPGYSWFYDRERVNDYLGFDRSVFTENGFGELVDPYVAMWHSDQQLADYLLADLDAADGSPLFSFAVSYQNHGPYAETESTVPYVSPEASGWSQESCNILNNYLFGVNETVREYVRLTQELDARDTPVVLVLFGDHKPWMGNGGSVYEEMGIDFDTSTLAGFRNYYATPYLIWANRAAKEVLGADFTGEGGDFSPCFLMTRLFDACGWAGPGYMQLSRAMRDISPLLHTNGLFLHDGVLTSVLSDTDRSFYHSWLAVQYYREHVAAYS